ncbi:MAG: outer membrane beta-barrel protein, partial [Treponema sp.]|nr:outer membrane beta-barrel protein [Treponema sp.]
ITLDKAIQGAHTKIESELPQGTKIIVLNFNTPASRLSDYVIDQLTAKLVNNKKLIVVERKDMDLINEEMAFQLSGEVSDESAQAIGKKLGAESIASGKFETLGTQYQFSIKTIHVETATIELFYQTPIKQDQKLNTLLGITGQRKAAKQEEVDQQKAAKQNAQAAQEQQAAARRTKLLLGVRGGIGGISTLGNQAGDFLKRLGTEASPLFPEQVYSVYFGTNSLNSLMGFQVEGNFHLNTGMTVEKNGETYEVSYSAVDIPVLLRLGVAGGGMFSLFGGPYVSIPLSKLTSESGNKTTEYEIASVLNFMGSYGILGGISIGFKVGPGYIALDGRYSYDFNEITINKDKDEAVFRRRGFNVSLGYELWL